VSIDAKQAISIAREHFSTLFEGEAQGRPTLEEIWFDDAEKVWCVTFGIRHRSVGASPFTMETRQTADYRTVRVTEGGKPLSIKLHDTAA
jgi:hypothetical protein